MASPAESLKGMRELERIAGVTYTVTLAEAKEIIKTFYRRGPKNVPAIFLWSCQGVGKHVTKDTLIVTENGVTRIKKVIDRYVKKPIHNPGFNECTQMVNIQSFDGSRVVDKFSICTEPTVELETECGYKIKCAAEHLLLGVDGAFKFKYAKDYKPGDWVVIAPIYVKHGEKFLSEDAAYLLGYFIGDGSFSGGDLMFAVSPPEIASRQARKIEKVFGVKPRIQRFSDKNMVNLRLNKKYDNLIEPLGITKNKSKGSGVKTGKKIDRRFWDTILGAADTIRIAFIRGFMDSDGGFGSHTSMDITQKDRTIVENLQKILLTLGVYSRIITKKKKYNGEYRKYYKLVVEGPEAVKFAKLLDFLEVPHKNEQLQKIKSVTYSRLRDRMPRYRFLPPEFREIAYWDASAYLQSNGMVRPRKFWKDLQSDLYHGKYLGPGRVSIEHINKVFEKYGIEIRMEIPENFYFDRVKSVRECGIEQVYDPSVNTQYERERNYWSDGFISHNSSAVRQCAHELGIGFIDLRLSQIDPTDLKGFPSIGAGEVRWIPPSFLPRSGSGILFLDELNLAPPAVQAAAYQLLLDRAVGDYKLPDGWLIVAAGNPETISPYIYEMAPPLANRLVHIVVRVDLETWKQWAYRAGIDPSIIGFLSKNPDLLWKFDPTKPAKAYPTPRSWEFVSKILSSGLTGSELQAAIFGAIGEDTGRQFLTFLELERELPDPIQVIQGKVKPTPEKIDVLYYLITRCVAMLPRIDVGIPIQEAVDNLVAYANYLYKYAKDTGKIPVAISILLIRDLIDAGFENYLMESKELDKCLETGPCSRILKTY